MTLEDILSDNSNYAHGRNIRTKLDKKPIEAKKLMAIYIEYISRIRCINRHQPEEKIIKEKVKLLNDYYKSFDEGQFDKIFSAQSKLRSTILEEFLCILFEDLIEEIRKKFNTNNLKSGGAKAYSNLYFSSENLKQFVDKPSIGVNQKDQDYTIYRPLTISVNGYFKKEINLPIVSIEAKTYIDKTMLEGSIATAEKIKSGNPYAKFYMVSETYEVDQSVDPAYSRIDQIFVLRKSDSREARRADKIIDDGVVISLYYEVKAHLEREWGNIKKKLSETGKII